MGDSVADAGVFNFCELSVCLRPVPVVQAFDLLLSDVVDLLCDTMAAVLAGRGALHFWLRRGGSNRRIGGFFKPFLLDDDLGVCLQLAPASLCADQPINGRASDRRRRAVSTTATDQC